MGAQNKTTGFESYDETTAALLLADPKTIYSATKVGDNVVLTMNGTQQIQGKGEQKLPTQSITIPRADYEKAFGKGLYSPNQEVQDRLKGWGNTDPEAGPSPLSIIKNPDAYQTAAYSKKRGSSLDAFPNVKNYNIKANLLALDGGRTQAIFYIQDPSSHQWKTIQSADAEDVGTLLQGFGLMNDESIRKILSAKQ